MISVHWLGSTTVAPVWPGAGKLRDVIAEIQCIPTPAGTPEVPYAHVKAAIAVIEGSGLTYEVSPLGTTIEGPSDQVWTALRATHEACLAAGADKAITVIKVFEPGPNGPTMDDLTDGYR